LKRRPAVALLVAVALAATGCTSTATVAPEARTALARTTDGDFVRLPTKSGGSVVFGPNATLQIDDGDGPTDVRAGDLYTNEIGLFQKNGELVSTWDDLRSVKVEQLDGASSVGASVAVAATVVLAVVAIAAIVKATSGGSSSHGSRGSSHGHGSSGSKPTRVRSAPNPSPIEPDPVLAHMLLRTAETLTTPGSPSAPTAPSLANGRLTVSAPDTEEGPTTAVPLFSRGARRRANLRGLARLEGGICWPTGGPNGDCMATGARAGLRLVDLIEVSAGLRVESDFRTAKPLAVVGAMVHGEASWAHWFALAVGASVAFDGTRAHVVPELALRFRPAAGLWLGVVPLEPVYRTEDGGWTMVSGVELTGEL
jgi:hypothetical protein